MKIQRSRAPWATGLVSALLLAVGLFFAPVAAAEPAGTGVDPGTPAQLIIHKLIQPQDFGQPATGYEDPTVSGTPVSGVTFAATQVPGVDLTTPQGWQTAASMTVAEALAATAGLDATAQGTTDGSGFLALDMPVGMYLVQETSAPDSIVPSAPFLVTLPHPTDSGDMLYDVHVYPKNAQVEANLSVFDQDAVSCGDSVRWTSLTSVPLQQAIPQYVVQNILAPGLTLTSLTGVEVSLTGTVAPKLTPSDYDVTLITVDGKDAVQVTFTQSGLAKLAAARAADPTAQVSITYPTTVTSAGIHQDEVRLRAGNAGPVTATQQTKFGPLIIRAFEQGNPQNATAGAVFELYPTAEDAAAHRNPISIGGQSRWTTDETGSIVIGCLRYSTFVNGLDVPSGSPDSHYYYAQPISYPSGWTGSMDPQAGTVGSTSEHDATVLKFPVIRPTPIPTPGPNPPGGGEMPVTGAQIAGVSMLAVVMMSMGAIMVARRRRDRGRA